MVLLRRYIVVVCTSICLLGVLAFPASAQNTLTGRLVEQIPGGNAIAGGSISLRSVVGGIFKSLGDCGSGVIVDCISTDGTFNAIDLPNGLYLLESLTFPYLFHSVGVTVNGNTNMGDFRLIRLPFQLTLTLGQIPAAGGAIPVSARVRTRWNIPTLPITVRISTSHEGLLGSYERETPLEIDLTWQAGVTDTGVVSLAPIAVGPSDPAGTFHCVRLVITLQDAPDFELANSRVCGRKRP